MLKNTMNLFRGVSNIPARTFVSTRAPGFIATLATKAPSAEEIKNEKKLVTQKKKELTKLSTKLTKEKTSLKKLQQKVKEESKKLDVKIKAREQKEKEAALKHHKKISGYTFFIKENKGDSLVNSAAKWNSLSEIEKDSYSRKADSYNEEVAQKFAPRPKKPVEGYALYVKENYVNDGRSVPEISKELGLQWKLLSADEKSKYKISQSLKDDYGKKLEKWTQERLRAYQESK
jgi:exonuclease VII large subunit